MTLDDLKAAADPAISTAAANVARYKDELGRGEITAAEYNTLVSTALKMDTVAGLAKDAARAAIVQEAFKTLLSLALS